MRVRCGNLRVGGGGGLKDRGRRDVTLVFLYSLRKYSGYVPPVPCSPAFKLWKSLQLRGTREAVSRKGGIEEGQRTSEAVWA
jgi:hypothetical protein